MMSVGQKPWNRKNPKGGDKSRPLTLSQTAKAKKAARKARRPIQISSTI